MVTYLAVDGLGSIVAEVVNGAIAGGKPYHAFGGSWHALSSRFLYTGREATGMSDVYYYRARYYESSTGRFISEDPIGVIAETNPYRYVGNDPVRFFDPLGLERVNRPYPPAPPIPRDQQVCQGKLQYLWLLKQEAESWDVNDKWKHCYLGCEIAKACGNVANFTTAWAKEVADAATNFRNWLSRDPRRRRVEFADIQATRAGEPCSRDRDGCDCCCRRRFAP